jgi:hypothetical protein
MQTTIPLPDMSARWYRCELGPEKTICNRVLVPTGTETTPVLYVPIYNAIPTVLDPSIVTAAVLQHHTVVIRTAV